MKVLSPAKINLFLQVIGKRPDGFHELFSLMCCLDLFDIIFLQFGGKKIEIESSDRQIPLDETNIAHKAATLFFKSLKCTDGLNIRIEKSIPVAAGLGGGSSNAASVLAGLNQNYGFPFSLDELMSMGLEIGADVPFFLFQKPALASGVGEKLEAYSGSLPFHILLLNPGVEVHTAEVFQNLNLGLTKCKKKFTKPSLRHSGFDPSLHLCNDLETVTISKYPVIESLKKQLLMHGALGALMSGSGPSVFGLFSDPRKAGEARQAIGRNIRANAYLADIIDKAFVAVSDY
ncbi:MAG: 4-(cytidine 5'-diphospho)-2-C-methyl-D-erythritol kinase [Desulfobacteraceae bacterium]|jgi:4-diphosphocytidyl-2-C-methyl-D-erythritol kinase|nr:4-(cytidine 5'-diphospho)-2-C-methyl-D-erythritol kinase [Desulfobacteraceae bacterium]